MKNLFLIVYILLLASCSGADGDNKVPLVGHWSWYQITVNHPNSAMYSMSPSICIGDIDVHEDGTYKLWNICKRADSANKVVEEGQGTWYRISENTYRANDDYDVIVDKSGNFAMFASTATDGNLNGHYEYGHMFKNVYFDHNTMK